MARTISISVFECEQIRLEKKTQEVKMHPGGTGWCITLLRSRSLKHINEDDKYGSIYQISSTIQRNYFIFSFPFPPSTEIEFGSEYQCNFMLILRLFLE